jgi:glucose-6-phosphate isomerase, archaeal
MESMASIHPFNITYSIDPLAFEPKEEIIVRKLSTMKEAFIDQAAAEAALARGEDPKIVEVFMAAVPHAEGFLMANINVVYPGKVGTEYYMTKGHIHDDPDHAPEIYITVKGSGKLLMQNLAGEYSVLDMAEGIINYIPAPYAHRCVNTGSQPLVYLGVFPADTERDYSFDSRNFKKLVVEQDGQAALVDNPLAK